MALRFNGSNAFLEYAGAIVTSYPFTLAIEVAGENGSEQSCISNGSSTADAWQFAGSTNFGTSKLASDRSAASGSFTVSKTTTPHFSNTAFGWLIAVFTSASSRTVYFGSNTGLTDTGAISQNFADFNRALVGAARRSAGLANFSAADLAEGHWFNVAFSSSDVATLLGGTVLPEAMTGWVDGVIMNPGGTAGSAVTGSLISIGGKSFVVNGGVTVSSLAHPVSRGTPAPVLSAPTAETPGTTTITLSATSDRASDGTVYFLRRVGGTQALGTTVVSTGESQAATANPQSRGMTGFTAGSANNYVDMVQVGAGGNSNVVTAGPFTMASVAVPILSTPTRSTPISTAVAPGFTTDNGTGTARGIVIQSASAPTTPSIAQVKAGQNAAGNTTGVTALANLTVGSTGAKVFALATVPTAGLTYWPFIVHTDGSGNDSTVLIGLPHYPGTGRAVSDVSITGWTVTGAPSGAAAINEDTSNRATFITGPVPSGTPSLATFNLDKPYPPGTYSFSIDADMISGTCTARVKFFDGAGTLLGTSANQTLTAASGVQTFNVTIAGGTATRGGFETQA